VRKTFSIYRSSAGSGKTRTLAKEYLKLALQHKGYYFQHILAVTFTNKSTQEMKDRILAYLNEFSNNPESDLAMELMETLALDKNTFIERSREVQQQILHHYSQFSISTIDAFFQKIIRSFTRESGLMGDYRLEVEQDLVLEEVIDDLIDELGSNQELTSWVVEFAKDNLENERAWDVRHSLRDFAQQIFREEFKTIEDHILTDTNDHNFFANLKSKLWKIKNGFLNRVSKPAAEALAIIQHHGWDLSEISYGKNSGLFSFFEMYANQKNLKDFKTPGDRLRTYFNQGRNWPKKGTPRAAEITGIANEKLIPLLTTIIDAYDQDFELAISAEVALRNMYVFGLIADIARKLKAYNYQNNLMLLADAPKFLNGIIQDSDTPFIYEKVGSFYRHFLIDEFQDTSGYQWKNFLPLLTNSLDQGNYNLVVGDVKQAIYRWRGGDLNLLQQLVEAQIGAHRVEVKALDTNYRSAPCIVEFNNKLFRQAASRVSAKTNQALPSEAFQDIMQKVHREETGVVEVQFIKKEEEEDENWKAIALNRLPGQLEQLQLAGVALNDIAILVRKNDEGQEIAAHLLQYTASGKGRPGCRYDVISNESLRVDGAAVVNVLLGAMRYLHNPEDAIARAQLGYEVARLSEPDRLLADVFTVANQAFFESNLPQAFSRSKAWLKKLPLFELTETLIEIFNLGQVPGELAYLQAFQDIVLDFYTRERNDLGAFLEWWEENKHKKSLQVSGEVEAAQIVTIHKSKGLQFKFVLIPFCSWNMDHDNFKAPLLWVTSDKKPFNDAGFLPVAYSSKLKETYFREFYEEELTRCYLDNLNLLYVALTRAEQGLFIMAPHPGKGQKSYSVATLLYECIAASPELQNHWNENLLQWKAGEVKPTHLPKGGASVAVQLQEYVSNRWRERLLIKKSPAFFVEEENALSLEKIRHGLQVHAVLSRIGYAPEIPVVLEQIVREGFITEQEKKSLASQLNQLMDQPQIAGWFAKPWEVRTEVPILLPGGEESRIDRLMIHQRKAVVVDFKTGDHHKRDVQQVHEYMSILRQMNFTEVTGYLLYIKEGEVVDVAAQRVKRIPKKSSDDQLTLEL
jgi:ATP-dependent helicase/nuclease subunit A